MTAPLLATRDEERHIVVSYRRGHLRAMPPDSDHDEADAAALREAADMLARRPTASLADDLALVERVAQRFAALADKWEARCDAIAITYQDVDARTRATAAGRAFVADIRAVLAAVEQRVADEKVEA